MIDYELKYEDRVFKSIDGDVDWSIESYKSRGGYWEIKNVLKKSPEDIIFEIAKSGIQGKGGAGFPTAIKWSAMQNPTNDRPNYLVCNADEGEPGTFKDRAVLMNNPHVLIEGIIVASHALRVNTCYVYIRGEYNREAFRLQQAINEAYNAGLLKKGKRDIFIHRGAGSYVCGEETALLESIEGKIGLPRIKPPYPFQNGLFGCPTIVNNVETLSQVGAIATKGLQWWTSLGSSGGKGTKLFSVSGDVNEPKVIEAELGIPLRELIEDLCGGVKGGWDNLQAVIPGGISSGILTAEEASSAAMNFESLQQFDTTLGTGGVIVINKDNSLSKVVIKSLEFYKNESCGQCSPCREGLAWLYDELKDTLSKENLSSKDIQRLEDISRKIRNTTVCGLPDGAIRLLSSFIKKLIDFNLPQLKRKQL